MDNLNEREKKQLEYLLADFTAVKSEIARRSTLQWFILGGYFSALAFAFQRVITPNSAGLWLTATWVVAALAYQFYAREYLEIMRLSRDVIRVQIAMRAGHLLNLEREDLLPSETSEEDAEATRRYRYARSFNWVAFFLIPLLLTLLLLLCYWHGAEIQRLLDFRRLLPWEAVVSITGALRILVLLVRHPV